MLQQKSLIFLFWHTTPSVISSLHKRPIFHVDYTHVFHCLVALVFKFLAYTAQDKVPLQANPLFASVVMAGIVLPIFPERESKIHGKVYG
jgi:hypothetical protein